MSFLTPLWLALAGLVAAILALHMVRRREIIVPSIMLWRRLNRPERRSRRLQMPRITVPLVLQVMIVLLTAAALAHPVVGAFSPQVQHRVFILDRSASMQTTDRAPSRFAQARDALAETLAGLDRERSRVSILTVGGPSHLLAARLDDVDELASAVRELPVTGGAPDWRQAADLLAAAVQSDEATAITILTDGSDAGLEVLTARFPEASVHTRVFGQEGTANAGLVAHLQRPPAEKGTSSSPWLLTGTLTVAGDMPAPAVSIAFRPAGGAQTLDWGTIESEPVEAGGAGNPDAPPEPQRKRAFETRLDLPGSGMLTISIPDDAGPFDNTLFFPVEAEAPPLSILYIGQGNPRVEGALGAIAGAEVTRSDSLPQTGGFDLVVADNAVLPERPQTNTLWLGTARLAGSPEPTLAREAEFTRWRDDHPLSRELGWGRLGPTTVYGFEPLAGATVVAGTGELAAVEARTVGQGREVRAALSLDTGWVQGPEFPTFVENVVRWLEADTSGPCRPGAACTIPATLAAAPVFGPDGALIRAGLTGQEDAPIDPARTSFWPTSSGIFTVGEGATALPRLVNPVASETAVAAVPGGSADAGAQAGAAPQIWWWLVLAIVILLLIEAAIAGRGLWTAALSRAAANARTRRWLGQMSVRAAAILSAVLALMALPFPSYAPLESVVVVMEAAFDGGDPPRSELAQRVADRCAAAPGARLGQVVLGPTGRIAADIGCDPAPEPAGAAPMGTNVRAGLDIAAAMIGPRRPGRIILASGGDETVTAMSDAGADPRPSIDIVALEDGRPSDAYVAKLIAPDRIFEGDPFPLTALVNAGSAMQAQVRILADGEEVAAQSVSLDRGGTRIETTVPRADAGAHTYAVEVDAEGDPTPINDRMRLAVGVDAAPRVALITPEAAGGRFFADALAVQGLAVDVLPPTRAPYSLDDWLAYDTVVLLNVPAIDLDTRQQEQIDTLVGVHGRGLVILGGENTFGPGGYYQTPLDRVSPLSSRIPEEGPAVALAFVLDRSGSMQALVEGVTRLEIAKEATNSAVDLLNPESQVAVVVFDSEATALVPLQERLDAAAIARALGPLVPGGGTSVYPALDMALDELQGAQASIRHIIVMSDGLSQPGDSEAIIARAVDMGITISAVAIGRGADAGRLEGMARIGGGSFNKTDDFRALPGILSQEAMMLGGEPMEEGPFPVAWGQRDADFLQGLPDTLPDVGAIVETTAKDDARVHLVAQRDGGETAPLMASWRYGVGQVLAFASHGVGPGTRDWAEQPYYPQMWSQIVRHFLPPGTGPGFHLDVRREGDVLIGEVEAIDPDGDPEAGLEPVLSGGREGEAAGAAIPMEETAPGLYSARFVPDQPGRYAFRASAGEKRAEDRVEVSYPARFDFSGADVNRLTRIAQASGGRMVSAQEADLVAARGWVLAPAYRPWLLLGLALFMIELFWRYTR